MHNAVCLKMVEGFSIVLAEPCTPADPIVSILASCTDTVYLVLSQSTADSTTSFSVALAGVFSIRKSSAGESAGSVSK